MRNPAQAKAAVAKASAELRALLNAPCFTIRTVLPSGALAQPAVDVPPRPRKGHKCSPECLEIRIDVYGPTGGREPYETHHVLQPAARAADAVVLPAREAAEPAPATPAPPPMPAPRPAPPRAPPQGWQLPPRAPWAKEIEAFNREQAALAQRCSACGMPMRSHGDASADAPAIMFGGGNPFACPRFTHTTLTEEDLDP